MEQKAAHSNRQVRLWLLAGVIMLSVQVILGGITRLTGSGLSITEWNLLTGTLPPLSAHDWQIAFGKYQHTPQYRWINADFTIGDFKFIYFWEWLHRLWARLVGLVFLTGFLYLLATKRMNRRMVKPLLVLFCLGALQGAVGWIMVASGLTGDAIYVAPTRLALHFVFALVLICYSFWFYLQMVDGLPTLAFSPQGRGVAGVIFCLVFIQLCYGALMAGHKAAALAPSWPTLNGYWLPPSNPGDNSGIRRLLEDKMLVQFIHRSLAYLLLLLTAWWSIALQRNEAAKNWLGKTRWLPLGLLTCQVLLGILSLINSPGIIANRWVPFDSLALLHQLTAILFLLSMVFMVFISRRRKARP